MNEKGKHFEKLMEKPATTVQLNKWFKQIIIYYM